MKEWIIIKWIAMILVGAGFIVILEIIYRRQLYPHIRKPLPPKNQ